MQISGSVLILSAFGALLLLACAEAEPQPVIVFRDVIDDPGDDTGGLPDPTDSGEAGPDTQPPVDTGSPPVDTGSPNPDTGVPDTGPPPDTGGVDAGIDTGPADTGLVDTGPQDTAVEEDLPSGGTVLFTEVVDHASFGNVRYVEIWNATGGPIRLEGWSVEFWNDQNNGTGAPDAVYMFPNVIMSNGAFFVVAKDEGSFLNVFDEMPANDYSEIINGAGEDTYVLRSPSGVVDIYGEVGVDGNGQPWFYRDSVATRQVDVISGSMVWQSAEWIITAGPDDVSPGLRGPPD